MIQLTRKGRWQRHLRRQSQLEQAAQEEPQEVRGPQVPAGQKISKMFVHDSPIGYIQEEEAEAAGVEAEERLAVRVRQLSPRQIRRSQHNLLRMI